MNEGAKVLLSDIFAENDIVFFDTCSIISDGFIPLMIKEAKILKKKGKMVSIHKSVLSELIYLSLTKTDGTEKNALYKLKVIKALCIGGVLNFIGEYNRSEIADHQLYQYAMSNRTDKKIAIVTQDSNLIWDLQKINNIKSFTGNDVGVYKLTKKGNLYDHTEDESQNMYSADFTAFLQH